MIVERARGVLSVGCLRVECLEGVLFVPADRECLHSRCSLIRTLSEWPRQKPALHASDHASSGAPWNLGVYVVHSPSSASQLTKWKRSILHPMGCLGYLFWVRGWSERETAWCSRAFAALDSLGLR